jgi:hypothetical protein
MVIISKTFQIFYFYFPNLGGPLTLGARGKLPPLIGPAYVRQYI